MKHNIIETLERLNNVKERLEKNKEPYDYKGVSVKKYTNTGRMGNRRNCPCVNLLIGK